jgi:hypothetical protein
MGNQPPVLAFAEGGPKSRVPRLETPTLTGNGRAAGDLQRLGPDPKALGRVGNLPARSRPCRCIIRAGNRHFEASLSVTKQVKW